MRIFSRQTDFFKEIRRYLTTMHGNQLIKLSFIDNYSWKKLSLNWVEEVARLQHEEYMPENCGGKKYFLMNLDTEGRMTRLPKFGFVKSCPKKGDDRSLSHPL